MASFMRIRSVIFVALTAALTILLSLAIAMGQTEVGGFDIANFSGVNVTAICNVRGDNGYSHNFDSALIGNSSEWGAVVYDPSTAMHCSFLAFGRMEAHIPVWEKPDSSRFDLPFACNVICRWVVNEIGFLIEDPQTELNVLYADWVPLPK
ncbi:unnamed protein product [Calypogeia fissa]